MLSDFLFLHAQLLGDNFTYAIFDIAHDVPFAPNKMSTVVAKRDGVYKLFSSRKTLFDPHSTHDTLT